MRITGRLPDSHCGRAVKEPTGPIPKWVKASGTNGTKTAPHTPAEGRIGAPAKLKVPKKQGYAPRCSLLRWGQAEGTGLEPATPVKGHLISSEAANQFAYPPERNR